MGWGYNFYDKPKKIAIAEGSGVRGSGKYGLTWWGQQWLNAFEKISDDNRLPRGKTYANNGSVRDIKLLGNRIEAEVSGSRIYEINIEIPLFSEKEQAKIAEIVANRPDLLAQLLNRALPAEIEAACLEAGIKIFPKSWKDLKADCSCPDYASPCKHLAAIIYLVAAEIDKNPFVVFALHGFDLVAALQKSGYAAAETSANLVPKVADDWDDFSDKIADFTPDLAAFHQIDYSKIPDLQESLFSLLAANSVFYPDFKNLLKKNWSATARFAANSREVAAEKPPYFSGKTTTKTPKKIAEPEPEIHYLDYSTLKNAYFTTDETGGFLLFTATDLVGNSIFEADSMQELVVWLAEIPAGRLADLCDELRGVWLAWQFSEACARHSACVPQVVSLPSGAVVARWLPALSDAAVRQNFEALQKMVPPSVIAISAETGDFQPKKGRSTLALSVAFLNFYVENADILDSKTLLEPIPRLFFKREPQVFEKFVDREKPNSMALWLGRFFISEKKIVPVIAVEENENGQLEVRILADDRRQPDQPDQPPTPLAEVLSAKKWADGRIDFLRDISILGEYFPKLNEFVAEKGKKPLVFEISAFAEILFKTLPVVGLLGIRVLLPKALAKIIRPQATMRMTKTAGAVLNNSPVSLKNLLQYNWQIALGDQEMEVADFENLLKKYGGLVKIRDQYVFFDEKEMKKLAERLAKPPALTGQDLLQIALAEEYEGAPIVLSAELKKLISELRSAGELALPDGLLATLRPYQMRGFSWLVKNARLGFGSILADDMGLGKTVQVISALLQLKKDGLIDGKNPALIIVPTTLLTNWVKEVARFAPALSTVIFHGAGRSKKTLPIGDLVLTSYGTARTDIVLFEKTTWAAVIIDEAQAIKNPGTEQTKAVKKINAPIRIAMSGTPVENRLSEYWSVFDFANKGYLHSLDRFKKDFSIPIESERDQNALRKFRKVTEPFVMRRLKTDKTIISDLPEKVERNQFCSLTPEQAALYETTVEETMAKIERADGIARRGLVLVLIMALKQICNHPSQYLKRKNAAPEMSGKCPLLLDLLQQAAENNEKTIIFTQFQEMGNLLAPMISEKMAFEVPFLNGSTSRENRDKMVENFQNDPAQRVLLLSLKAGGTGLNLTAASQVVHFDLWWNPAVEAQATDRAFRIGQKRNVQVHRFITEKTFEEKINELLQKKKALAEMTVGTGEGWIGDLSDKDLRAIFSRK